MDPGPSFTTLATQTSLQLAACVLFRATSTRKRASLRKRQSQVTDGGEAESCPIRTKRMCGVFHLAASSLSLSSCLHRQHRVHKHREREGKKSSSCLIHLTLDTYKVQLKARAATIPPFPPPGAPIQVSWWCSGLVDFPNPLPPCRGFGEMRVESQ